MLKNILKRFFLIVISLLFISTFSFGQDFTPTPEQMMIYNLTEQLEKTNKALEDMTTYAESLESAIDTLTVQLANTNDQLIFMKERVADDQIEITDLRDRLKRALRNQEKFYRIGIGISYPLGGQLVFGLTIPRLPIGFYASLGLSTPPVLAETMTINVFFAGGILIRF